jgi:hypothetical protein
VTLRKLAKAEKEYVRGLIHNLSLQRWTDQEITNYIVNEKQIQIGRSTVASIRTQVDKSAEKWYIELKKSSYKYIAHYKTRLDSLLSYQKQLQDIVKATKKEDTKIKGLSTIASIEMNIFTIWKQLPDLDIVDKAKKQTEALMAEQQEGENYRAPYMVDEQDLNGVEEIPQHSWNDWVQCNGCKRWWSRKELLDYHQRQSQRKNAGTICDPEYVF